jgi:putative salt-induced outer membrane protein
MKLKNYLAILASLAQIVFMAGVSSAQERNWEDAAELSYVQTGGNTEVLTFSGKNSIKYAFSESWTSEWDVGLLYGKTDGEKTAEQYYTDLRTDYNFSDNLYYFLLGGWEKDRFSGLDKRIYLGPGMGYNILTGETHFLSTEAGIDYATEDFTDGSDHEFMEGRVLSEYEYVFNPKTKFKQTAKYLHNFEDADKFRINTVSSLTTQLNDMFSLKVNYELKYRNQPSPRTLKKTDTLFSVALVVNF